MASRYSVIQYVPNPIANERINIGVLVFDEQDVRVHFLQSWDRVRCFGQSEDIDLLKNFAREMQEVTKEGLLFSGDRPSDLPAHERLVKVSRGWMNGIQFTEPCGSLSSVDQLVEDMAQTYLMEPPEKKQKLRDRQLLNNFKIEQVVNEESISKIYTELSPIFDKNTDFKSWHFIGKQNFKSTPTSRKNKTFLPHLEFYLVSFILFSYVIAFISRLSKENKISDVFITINILSLGIYIFYRIIRFFVEEYLKNKDRVPLKTSLKKSTLNHEMTDLEKSYFPDFNLEEIKTITEHLSLYDLFSLQLVELYLNRFNKIAEKNLMYFQRFYTFGIAFILSFVAFSDFKYFLINGIISAFVLLEVYLEKYSVFGKIVLSLHVLKEAQLIKAKREML